MIVVTVATAMTGIMVTMFNSESDTNHITEDDIIFNYYLDMVSRSVSR